MREAERACACAGVSVRLCVQVSRLCSVHAQAETLIKHADKTTLYFTELYGDIFKIDVEV